MNPTSVAVEAPPATMTAETSSSSPSLPAKNAAKEAVEGILYGSVRRHAHLVPPDTDTHRCCRQ